MATQFKDDFSRAKKARKNRFLRTTFFIFLSFLGAIFLYAYVNSFRIVVNPTSLNYSINTEGGFSAVLGDRVLLPFGESTVVISAFGFIDERRIVSAGIHEKTIVIHLRLAEVGVLLATTEIVSNPRWIVDGLVLSSVSRPTLKLKPGTYDISVSSDYHDTGNATITLEPGISTAITLKVNPKLALYNINTSPSGSQIFIDDILIGKSPLRGEMIAGLKRIRITKEGYAPVIEEINTTNEPKTIARTYHLDTKLRNIKATFKPNNGQLFIDGVPQQISSSIKAKASSETTIDYEVAGYRRETKILSLSDTEITFDLEPIFGQLEISSTPTAEALVGGKSVGQTPLKLTLLAKEHEVSLLREGYVRANTKIAIKPKGNHKYQIEMTTLSQQRLSQSQRHITNSLGMAMTRFQPKKIEIGAPRNQKGQRANEHLRRVNFGRAIYFGNFEVTQDQYATFRASQGSIEQAPPSNVPIHSIDWADAITFCNWLSLREGFKPFYKTRGMEVIGFDKSSLGYRLPTEAEWEYVARLAGKNDPTIFVWGNEYKVPLNAGNLADYSANGLVKIFLADYNDGYSEVAPIGSFDPEPSGVYDMSGNVSEWVHDFYSLASPKPDGKYFDYMGSEVGPSHVIKGSNYLSADWTELRASFKETSNKGRIDVGFRIARYIN